MKNDFYAEYGEVYVASYELYLLNNGNFVNKEEFEELQEKDASVKIVKQVKNMFDSSGKSMYYLESQKQDSMIMGDWENFDKELLNSYKASFIDSFNGM